MTSQKTTKKATKKDYWEKYAQHMTLEGVTRSRINKLHAMYTLCERGLRVPLADAKRDDLEAFLLDLHSDKILSVRGTKLSSVTKSDAKKFLRQFFKWLRGNGELFPPEVAWIKTRIAKDERPKEKEVIGLEEVKRLATSFRSPSYRVLTLLLFDSGFRVSEMLSARKRDLKWEAFDKGNECFWVSCQVSKTITRKVPVPLFTDEIQLYVRSVEFEEKNENDPLFNVSYFAFLKQIRENSKKLFGKKVTPHALRHSSATYYSMEFEGNTNLLSERFGWSYNSAQLATYIRKSGAYQKPQAKRVFENDVIRLRKELDEERQQRAKMQEQIDALARDLIQAKVKPIYKQHSS